MKTSTLLLALTLFCISSTLEQPKTCTEVTSPNLPSDCNQFHSGDPYGDFCCFYKNVNDQNKKKCKLLPYTSLQNVMTYDMIENELYSVNCGEMNLKGKSVLSPCGGGLENPSLAGCKSYSSYVDSCCYFDKDKATGNSYPVTETGCYWLGSKYMGDITWGSLKLQCSSNYLRSSFLLIGLMILHLFI